MDGRTDGQLLAEVDADGSQASFAELVRRHGAMVHGVCRRQLGDGGDADDATQAVFLILWKKARSLRSRKSIAPWLHHVARNVCRDARKASRIRHKHERLAAQQTTQMPNSHANSVAEIVEMKGLLDEELDALSEKYRLPIILFHLEGRSLEEVAALLSTKPSTIGTRLARGREKLRSRLARRGLAVTATALTGALAASGASAAVTSTFISTTVEAASLYAAGTVAASGLVSAKAVALTQGTINMLTIAKLKLAAAVMATATVVTTTSVVVVQQVAQAKPDAAPAAVLPKEKNPGLKSMPVEKDGLSIVIESGRESYNEDEEWDVRVVLANVSKGKFHLFDPFFVSQQLTLLIEETDSGKKWTGRIHGDPRVRRKRTIHPLAPDDAMSVGFNLRALPQEGIVGKRIEFTSGDKSLPRLPAGDYRVRAEYAVEPEGVKAYPDFDVWSGTIRSGPITLKVEAIKE